MTDAYDRGSVRLLPHEEVQEVGLRLFIKYSISELAERTPYSESYLLSIKNGNHPVTEVFRLKVAKALGVSEDELFTQAQSGEAA